LFDRPAIGCARKLLAGNHRPVDEAKGSSQPLMLNGKEVGLVYRSKESVKPIYLSPGHKCDLPYTREVIARSLRGYRLPEPMRVAHLLANRYRQRTERDKVRANEPAMSGRPA
jgi:deoxyribonuclease V